MNSLRWCCPRVPVLDPEIGRRLGNDPGGASDVEAPRCEKLLAGFRLCGMRPEASRNHRGTPQGPACQRVRGRRTPLHQVGWGEQTDTGSLIRRPTLYPTELASSVTSLPSSR